MWSFPFSCHISPYYSFLCSLHHSPSRHLSCSAGSPITLPPSVLLCGVPDNTPAICLEGASQVLAVFAAIGEEYVITRFCHALDNGLQRYSFLFIYARFSLPLHPTLPLGCPALAIPFARFSPPHRSYIIGCLTTFLF